MKKTIAIIATALLLSACATTHFEIDPQTKIVRGSTNTFFKSVEGFQLIWDSTPEGHPIVTVKLKKSDPATELIEAISPLLRELTPMVKALSMQAQK